MENQNHKKIVAAIKAIGADYKSLHDAISAIQTQQGSGEQATLTKINELISQAETRILNKIKGGELSEDFVTGVQTCALPICQNWRVSIR